MAQINDFSGGLATRLHPAFIGTSEGVEYLNLDPSRGTLRSMFANRLEENTSFNNLYIFKGNRIFTNEQRDYVELGRKLYFTNGVGRPQKSSDGKTFYNLGITGQSEVPTVATAGAGNLSGTLQYCYTYYNEEDGTESIPTPYSQEITATNNQVVVTYVNSTDPQVSHVRLYRLGGTLTSMFMVAEIPNDESLVQVQYTDNVKDVDATRVPLSSYTNYPAFEGLSYLTEADTMLFAAKGNKLYFTEVGFPDYWSEFNYILIDDDITGISDSELGLLVFTEFKTFLISYGGSLGVTKTLLSGSQGCVAHRSIQYVNNTVVWASTDGICATSNGSINILSQGALGYLAISDVKASCVHDEVYYISFNNKTLAMDTRYGKVIFRYVDIAPSSFCLHNDEVYFIYKGFVQVLEGDKENLAKFRYKSGRLTEQSLTNVKTFKNYYFYSSGIVDIEVYLDGHLDTKTRLKEGFNDIKSSVQARQAYYIEFVIEGYGEVSELEFKVEGRQNGR